MVRHGLVIFDCDGVLVDSEILAAEVLARAATSLGLAITAAEALPRFRGRRLPAILAEIEAELSTPLPPDLPDKMRADLRTALASVKPVPGIAEALDRIDRPTCVASGGSMAKMRLTLGAAGLLPRFEGRLFSSPETGFWKPAPDLFLHAARALGFRPEDCDVVEDSTGGVEAGRAAGMRVLAFVSTDADAEAMGSLGAVPFRHMRELPDLLADRTG
ncbi:HAD family hydrolase [Muricoccus aerilatus]|uniref:HAD family hydrolase n=1 Tax=Muricoccus aerilatus TaxID=452982 RepID=UPI0005C13A96|nr:HAD family hydrolase [Roseomonas aerilata]